MHARLGRFLPARRFAAGSASVAVALASAVAVTAGTPRLQFADPDNGVCPPGYLLVDRAELIAERAFNAPSAESANADPARMLDPTCMVDNLPESYSEIAGRDRADLVSFAAGSPAGTTGLYSSAYASAEELSTPAAQAAVPNSQGAWKPYGVGNLIGDDLQYTETAAQGLTDLAGRIDSLVYDPDNARVFAAGGTSGIWMSDDLADTWVSIGDNLPSPANGAIAWTKAGGGTLVVVSGEPTFGGNLYAGVGAFWTNDLGATWNRAVGVPENALGFAVEADLANPEIVYVATSLGLYRSDDAGRTFTNVLLPTSPECAGNAVLGNVCDTANVVTDVMVMVPGGSTGEAGGQVIAAVGHRNEQRTYPTGEVRSPGQGLYRSPTGEVGTFEKIDTTSTDVSNIGFASAERQGRVEFGQASGDDQDHNYIYAIVSDPAAMAGASPVIDLPESIDQQIPDPRDIAGDLECEISGLCLGVAPNSALNGLYASPDFGTTWLRMADDVEIAENPASGSALAPVRALIAPGVQAWYNEWIEPDPTVTDVTTGAPARLLFGLEEIWSGVTQQGVPYNGVAQSGPSDFRVVGRYFGGDRCAFLDNPVPLPVCPLANPPTTTYTTHPDQHDALWIPNENGVTLLVANDGGVYRMTLDPLEQIDNTKWEIANNGMNTLLPYSVAVSEDGTVYLGLQDNGTAKIDPETGTYSMVYVGDGTFATVDPYDGNLSTAATPGGGFASSVDGGKSFNTGRGSAGGDSFQFVTPWVLDPTDETHLLTAGNKVHVSMTGMPGAFREVFELGSPESQPEIFNLGTAMAARGDAEYVAYCGVCDPYRNAGFRFLSGIATNVGGDEPGIAGESDGWHHTAAAGLPERYVNSLWVDAADAETVYAALGGYAGRRWAGIDTYTDPDRTVNSKGGHVYKSTDGGESFVDISGDLPDIRANWIIQRGSQLLVATDVGVFMSSDMNGTNWARLTGLPNHPVRQIQMQPEHPERLFAAVYGRSIWTYEFTSGVAPIEVVGPAPAPEPSRLPLPATGGGAAAIALTLLGAGWGVRRRGRQAVAD